MAVLSVCCNRAEEPRQAATAEALLKTSAAETVLGKLCSSGRKLMCVDAKCGTSIEGACKSKVLSCNQESQNTTAVLPNLSTEK